jgi:hypothetical protein
MAIFCKLNENNMIINIENVGDAQAPTQEAGEAFLRDLYKTPTTRYIKVVPGDPKLSRFSIDWVFREDLGGFVAPQPFPSWSLNETNCQWVPPVPLPEDATGPGQAGPKYFWDETNQQWILGETL